jgi:MYXO-CTERM domain-containing protein
VKTQARAVVIGDGAVGGFRDSVLGEANVFAAAMPPFGAAGLVSRRRRRKGCCSTPGQPQASC